MTEKLKQKIIEYQGIKYKINQLSLSEVLNSDLTSEQKALLNNYKIGTLSIYRALESPKLTLDEIDNLPAGLGIELLKATNELNSITTEDFQVTEAFRENLNGN